MKCIHDSGEGRKVACGLGLYGGNPHIGVCRRSCAMYQLPGESAPVSPAQETAPLNPIPKIMHFVWVQGEPPAWAKAIMAYWQHANPDYKVMLHDESAVAPEHQHIFDTVLTDRNNKNHIVSKADIIRADVLRRHGGWHIDMDFMPLATLDEIWRAFKPQDFMCLRHWRSDTLCNGLMCGTPDARIWPLLEAEWTKGEYNGDLNYYSTVCLGRLRGNPAVFFPKSPSHFFPPSYKEGEACIRLAEEMLSGRTSMRNMQLRLSCCGVPKPYAYHIGLRGSSELKISGPLRECESLLPVSINPRWESAKVLVKFGAPGLTIKRALPMTPIEVSYSECRNAMRGPGNVIVWGGNWSAATIAEFKGNTLWLENGLLNQSAGFYCDNRGLFGRSTIREHRLWETPPTVADIAQVKNAIKVLGWEWGQACDPNGPILIALQRRQDTGCHRYFPARGNEDSIEVLLRLCAKYLPNRPVIVRPHPKFREEWTTKAKEYQAKYFRANWTVNMEGGINPMLPKCSALVTVNSTIAGEALALNMPIATLGESVWSDSGATLECANAPDRLAGVLVNLPDMDRRMAVQSAILRRQVPYGNSAAFAKHPAFLEWLNRLQ